MAKPFDDIVIRISDEDRQRFDKLSENIERLLAHFSSEQPAEAGTLETICVACMQVAEQCTCTTTPHWGIRVSGFTPTMTTIMDNPGD